MSEKFVYADHAATTAVTDTALAAMLPCFTQDYGNPSSLYGFAQEGKSRLEQARAQVAACLNAKPEEVYFTSGGTEVGSAGCGRTDGPQGQKDRPYHHHRH